MIFLFSILVFGALCFIGWDIWESSAKWIDDTQDDFERRKDEQW